MLTIGIALSLLVGDVPDLAARTRHTGRVEQITASAKIKRGRVRRARTVATYRALRTVVWQRVEPLLASPKGRKRLQRRLGKNVRRLIIRKPDGDVLLEIPLTAGVAVGGAMTIMAPVLAALGALAALLAEFKLEVIRTDKSDGE